ncbi:MAG TPA: DNA polymerase Y family protein [Acidobacteriota bacterium]|nr:DNA polymerase Y family protein [Acidobacteriota bacterium]
MTGERVACLLAPDFPVAVCLRADPSLRLKPAALAENDFDAAPIIAVNHAASRAGLLPDMTLAQAGTLCPGLVVRVREITREIEESNAIFKKLQRFSPFVEETSPGKFFLDAAGLTLLHRSEAAFAARIIAAIRPLGYPVKVGIAKNRFVAETAARVSGAVPYTIIPSGRERTFLENLPVADLPLSPETRAMLHDLGLKTIGQLAAFPANEMTRRFGREGTALSRLARGDDTDATFSPAEPSDDELSNEIHLVSPIYTAGAVTSYVRQLLSPLLGALGKFSRGCGCVTIMLELDNHTQQNLPVTVERPTLSVSRFLRQLLPLLAGFKLSAGVTGIKVTIPEAATLLSEQLAFSSNEKISSPERTIDSDLIYVPQLCAAILPEQKFSLAPFSPRNTDRRPRTMEDRQPADGLRACVMGNVSGLRLLQPPRRIEITTTDSRLREAGIGRHRQPIRRYHGPWELSGGWWSVDFNRLYYEIQIGDDRSSSHRQLYLVFFERTSSRWFLQGIFD